MQRNTEQKIFCIKYNKSLFVQRQQYPQLHEPEVYSKAKVWKAFDETEQERRQASYKEVLSQQKSVSTSLNDCVHWCKHAQISRSHVLFVSHPSTAHTQHSVHTEQSKKSGDGLTATMNRIYHHVS